MRGLYVSLDLLFVIFHLLLIVFSLVGWIWRTTRRTHLLVLTLIMVSWFGLGIWYGIGYCPCTDWHWQVKRQLGEDALPISYVKYYLDWFTGENWNSKMVDLSVVLSVLIVYGISLWLNWRDLGRRRGRYSVSDG